MFIYLFIFCYLNCFTVSVFAIDCYQCVSSNSSDITGIACQSSFDHNNVPYIKNCKQQIAGQSQEAYACVKIVQKIDGTDQETIIRDCVAISMKQGCEKRQMSEYKLYGGPMVTMTQCVYTCHDSNGCNSTSNIQQSTLIGLISFLLSISNVIKFKFLRKE